MAVSSTVPVRCLLVASSGGHLAELRAARDLLLDRGRAVTWVTWESEQSRELLAGETCVFIDHVPPRSPRATVRLLWTAHKLLRTGDFDELLSTGALPAVPFFLAGRAHGIRCRYLETAARVEGPSLTGRLLEWLPGVDRQAQHPGWADGRRRWRCDRSVFDAFSPGPPRPPRLRRAVVMTGTSHFCFRRLVEGALAALPPECEVMWQTGSSDVSGLALSPVRMVPEGELREAVAFADLVVSHAGVGSALLAIELGHCPVLVPRTARHGEHTDDHQRELARELDRRGLAVHCEADSLSYEVLAAAAGRSTTRLTRHEEPDEMRDVPVRGQELRVPS